jgi:hypothetical protein
MRGTFAVKSKHPWQKQVERNIFQYSDDETKSEAETKARALIKERTARGWECVLTHDVIYAAEDHPPLFAFKRKPSPNIDMPFEDYLIHSGARYIEPFFAYENGEIGRDVCKKFNISMNALSSAVQENRRILNAYEYKRRTRYDNPDLRKEHREKTIVDLHKTIETGDVGQINLFFTVLHQSLVKDLKDHGICTVGQIDEADRMISAKPEQWMENDPKYISYAKGRLAEKDWDKLFWFREQPFKYLEKDPTFVPLGPTDVGPSLDDDPDDYNPNDW